MQIMSCMLQFKTEIGHKISKMDWKKNLVWAFLTKSEHAAHKPILPRYLISLGFW